MRSVSWVFPLHCRENLRHGGSREGGSMAKLTGNNPMRYKNKVQTSQHKVIPIYQTLPHIEEDFASGHYLDISSTAREKVSVTTPYYL